MKGNPYVQVPVYDLNPLSGEVVLASLRDYSSMSEKLGELEQLARTSSSSSPTGAGAFALVDPSTGERRFTTIAELARQITANEDDDWKKLEALHNFRRDVVGYEFRGQEERKTPRVTVSEEIGNCGDHSLVGAAMALAIGCDFSLVTMGRTRYDPAHMTLLVAPAGAPAIDRRWWGKLTSTFPHPGWAWSETTVEADFGEHPYAAAKRLGVIGKPGGVRHDLSVAAEEYDPPVDE